MPTDPFAARLDRLDLTLFDPIASESYAEDRLAWLAVQRSVRAPGYVYLEIGSHLGGSIQQHIADPLCSRIISIDPRPAAQPDDRGQVFEYPDNSTARMIGNLRGVAGADLGKLECHDSDAKDVAAVSLPPDLCFIDGEHTAAAVRSDFEFCLRVCKPSSAILFHDDIIIWRALRDIVSLLDRREVRFVARKLGGCTFAIFLRDCPALADPHIAQHSVDGRRWLRSRRLRALVPRPLRSAARWLKRQAT